MSNIAVLLCSRGRADKLKRMIDSCSLTADDPCALQFYIRVDDDDPTIVEYSELEFAQDCYRQYVIGKREGNIRPYNGLIKMIFDGDPSVIAVMISADDVIFRTQGWDTAIRNLDEIQKIYLAWFRDDKVNSICASHPVISRSLAERLDYNLLDGDYICFKADQQLTDICKKAGVSYFLREWLVEHMHPKYNKGDWDTTYAENRPDWCVNKDQEMFDSKVELREQQVKKLIGEV